MSTENDRLQQSNQTQTRTFVSSASAHGERNLPTIPDDIISRVPAQIARRLNVIPVSFEDGILTLVGKHDPSAEDEEKLEHLLGTKNVRVAKASEFQSIRLAIEDLLALHYPEFAGQLYSKDCIPSQKVSCRNR